MTGNRLAHAIQRLRRSVARPTEGPDDPELLRRYAAAREEPAFTALVQRHGPMVQGVCRRVLGQQADADDAFQATFLVLARKAGSAFWQESVAGWIYQVAYRIACKARTQAARRQRHEQAARSLGEDHGSGPELRELQQVLDEELTRLPEKFRLPVLLCCLQDQTTDEAARQLGWPFATVKGRLQRGREMLKLRLQKRGIGLSAGVLGTLLAGSSASAVPAALVASMVQAANGGKIAPAVAVLVKGALHAMFWGKWKIGAVVLLAATVIGVGGGIGFSQMESGQSVVLAVPIAEGQPGKTNPKEGVEGVIAKAKDKEEAVGFAVAVPEEPATKTRPPRGPMASNPVVKDGLEVVVKAAQARFSAGQVPPLEISYTNRDSKALRLFDVDYAPSYLTFTDAKSARSWKVGPWEGKDRRNEKKLTFELEPGKTLVRKVVNRQGSIGPVGIFNNPPAGTYRLTMTIGIRAGTGQEKPRFWSGEITTSPVQVVIAEPAPGPSITDMATGITVRVRQDRRSLEAVNGNGEAIWKTRVLPEGSLNAIHELFLNGGRLLVRCDLVAIAPRPANQPYPGFKIELQTGKILESFHVLPGKPFEWKPRQVAPSAVSPP